MTSTGERSTAGDPILSPRLTGRLLQTTFLMLFLFATALLLVIEPAAALTPSYGAGLALIVIVSIGTYLPAFDGPRHRPWMLAMPLADFMAFVLVRLEGTGGVTNPMIMMLMIPAAWFGLASSRRALLLIVPAVIAVVTPDIAIALAGGLPRALADRTLVVIVVFPMVAILAAAAAHVMARFVVKKQATLATEQTRRADALRETERARALLDSVLDSLEAGVVVLSPSGELLLMNRRLRESPGLAAQGTDPWTAFRSTTAYQMDRVTPISESDRIVARIERGELDNDRLVWVGEPNADQRALSISSSPVRTESGEHLATVILVSDVTEYIEALEAKDAFIGTVSHELRTPLTALTGFLEIMMERADQFDPEVSLCLQVMERNVHRQQMLVRDLLMAAGSRSSSLVIRRSRCDLAMIAREAAAAIGPEAVEKSIALTVAPGAVEGSFDPLRLAQVAENLLLNAVRHSPAGSTVEVSAAHHGTHLSLRVRDDGPGIPDDEQARLFEQFFRGQEARSSAVRGVGLGLSIVREIVDAHDGEIDLESEPGRGTTVTVRIPRDG